MIPGKRPRTPPSGKMPRTCGDDPCQKCQKCHFLQNARYLGGKSRPIIPSWDETQVNGIVSDNMADLVRNYWLNEIVLVLRGTERISPGQAGG